MLVVNYIHDSLEFFPVGKYSQVSDIRQVWVNFAFHLNPLLDDLLTCGLKSTAETLFSHLKKVVPQRDVL